ncbi:MAG: transposase [Patescibacteria group bacterium]
MPRIERVDVGGEIYHVINRANSRVKIFDNDGDYKNLEAILEEAVTKFDMRLLAYCIMPNHWHLVLHPKQDGDLSKFMGWLTNTHTRRWHTLKGTIGQGHLYQGRYKSFICQNDYHFLALVRYVERNAKRANMVKKVEDWKWSSAWRRVYGIQNQKKILSSWPISIPKNYLEYLNESQNEEEVDMIRRSIIKNIPFGGDSWCDRVVKKFNLEQTLRGVGRPKGK